MYVKIYIHINNNQKYIDTLLIVDKYINDTNLTIDDMTNIATVKYKSCIYKLYCIKEIDDTLTIEEELIKFGLIYTICNNNLIQCYKVYKKWDRKELFNFICLNHYSIVKLSLSYKWIALEF